jgi:hypothetical protein
MKYFLVLLIVLGLTVSVFAQEESIQISTIYLTDGSKLVGTIISQTSDAIKFNTTAGVELTIDRSKIKKIEKTEGTWHKGEFRRYDPNQTRLFFAPTARSLKAGKGYFSIYEIFFPMLSVGVADFFTLSGGMSLFPGAEQQLLYVAPKVRFLESEKFSLAGGVLYMSAFSEVDFGIFYGVTTYGTPAASVTAGLGWGFAEGETADKPFVMLGGEVQLSGSLKLITENWFPPGTDVSIFSFGLRFFGESLAGDFGLITTSEAGDGFPFLPWIGFVYNF